MNLINRITNYWFGYPDILKPIVPKPNTDAVVPEPKTFKGEIYAMLLPLCNSPDGWKFSSASGGLYNTWHVRVEHDSEIEICLYNSVRGKFLFSVDVHGDTVRYDLLPDDKLLNVFRKNVLDPIMWENTKSDGTFACCLTDELRLKRVKQLTEKKGQRIVEYLKEVV